MCCSFIFQQYEEIQFSILVTAYMEKNQPLFYKIKSHFCDTNCNTGTLILVPGLYICQDLAVYELRVRGATRLWVRLGRTDCCERNKTQEI